MTFDPRSIFAEASVATAPSPASSGTSLIVDNDFPAGAVSAPYNIIVAPSGQRPTFANAEICRVTAKGGTGNKTWTITRAQEGSAARSILVGDKVYLALTPKVLTDIENWLPFTTQGDLAYAASASLASRLGIGAALQGLRVNAGATAPEWAGGVSLIADSTLGSDQASMDFTGIPTSASIAHLLVVCYLRGSTAAATVGATCRLNNDSGGNYDNHGMSILSSTVTGDPGAGDTNVYMGEMPANSASPATLFSAQCILIPHYAGTTNHKSVISLGTAHDTETSTTTNWMLAFYGSLWRSASAINRLTILPASGNLKSGSRVSIYGLGV